MIIDNDYIINRFRQLVKEKQNISLMEKNKNDKLYDIKMSFPAWIRNIIFHPFNPAYSVFVQYKATKQKKKNYTNLQSLNQFAVNFWEYCLQNNFSFDTEQYFPKEDEPVIETYIENRLKSVIPGYTQLPLNKEQTAIRKEIEELSYKIKKGKEGYQLSLKGMNYYLPQRVFEEHTYIHEYGLKYLPEYIKNYVKGKDFLDVGAYLGDTSIFLLKNYAPNLVYAYEPVDYNAEQVSKTIKGNNTNKIILIPKGLGDKEESVDIYIDPNKLSGSSTNRSIASANQTEKKCIHISTIDNECKDKKVGLIKMDVEGVEYSVIKGALSTIKRDKPVLLISIYHTGKDFFEIAPLLKENVPEYLFRLIDIEVGSPFTEKILIAYPNLN